MYFKDSRSSQRSGLEVGGFHCGDPAGLAPQSSFGGKTKCRCPALPAGQGTLEVQERRPGVLGEWVGEGSRVLSAGAMSWPGCGGNHSIEDVVKIRVPCFRRARWSALRARPVEHSGSGHPTPLHHWQLGCSAEGNVPCPCPVPMAGLRRRWFPPPKDHRCYGLNCGPPQSYVEVLTPRTYDCDLIWKSGL